MAGTQQSSTVLVVEDGPKLAGVYADMLSDMNQVRIAHSGAEALSIMDSDVNVVLLDRQLPDMTGTDVLQRIQDEGYGCKVAIVTAYDPDESLLDLGFDEYVTKPVDHDELETVVRQLLRRRIYIQDLQEYFAVVSQIAAFDAADDPSGVGADEIQKLRERKATLRKELETLEDAFTPADFTATLRHVDEVDFVRDSPQTLPRHQSLN